jgi:hypothetical protein
MGRADRLGLLVSGSERGCSDAAPGGHIEIKRCQTARRLKETTPDLSEVSISRPFEVAGAGFEPATFGL